MVLKILIDERNDTLNDVALEIGDKFLRQEVIGNRHDGYTQKQGDEYDVDFEFIGEYKQKTESYDDKGRNPKQGQLLDDLLAPILQDLQVWPEGF